jgi:hypothetical protein
MNINIIEEEETNKIYHENNYDFSIAYDNNIDLSKSKYFKIKVFN